MASSQFVQSLCRAHRPYKAIGLINVRLFVAVLIGSWYHTHRVDGSRSSGGGDGAAATANAGRPVEYSISEEMPAGSWVGSVKLDTDLRYRYTADDLLRMRFHIRHAAGGHHDSRELFAIDENSGEIRTRRVIDRDRMCVGVLGGDSSPSSSSSCDVTFDVTVRPLTYFQIIKVVVHIEDVNDNAPTFPQDHVMLHVIETTPVGTLFLIPSADDADSAEFAVQGYQLRSASGDEEINDGPFELYVIDQVSANYR
jgi:hypothetical protein